MIIPTILFETSLRKKGIHNICGVDEAGKGPWAGPVTAGAVMIHQEKQVVASVRDSKLMSRQQREKAFTQICEQSTAYGVGIVDAFEIDTVGIEEAVRKAMLLAIGQLEKRLGQTVSYVLVDGSKTKPLLAYPSQRILRGGLYHYSIAAGSILAKVARDKIMWEMAKQYPLYAFEKHVGYGTKLHQELLEKYGPCAIHRKSFQPVKRLLVNN